MIAIVGAGPSGAYAASLLAKHDRVAIFEEHDKIGLPVQCTGITTSYLSRIVPIRKEFLVNKVSRVRVFSPNRKFVDFNLRNPNLVLDRAAFDKFMVNRAVDSGVELFTKHHFLRSRVYNNKIVLDLKGSNKLFSSNVLVGADGPFSQVARSNGMFGKRNYVVGVQARTKLDVDSDLVEFHLNKDFFGWVVPESHNVARVGIAAHSNQHIFFKDFMSKRVGKGKVLGFQSGFIPIYNPKLRTQKNNVYLVGDAATQVKATSIDYDEPILIKKDNLIMNVRIGEFVNSYMSRYKEDVIKEDENVVVNKLLLNDKVYSLSPDKKGRDVNFKTIKTLLKHEYKDDIFELILDRGYRIKCTGSHSIMTFSGNGFVEKKVLDLKEKKDYLFVTLCVPNNQSLKDINISKLIFDNAPHLINKVRVLGAKNLLFKKRSSIPKNFRSAYWDRDSIPLNKFYDKKIVPKTLKITFNPRKKNVIIPNVIEISPEFCRLLGYYCAEGTGKNKVVLSLGKGDIKNGNLTDLLFCIKSVFPDIYITTYKKLNPKTKKECGVSLQFGGKLLANFFTELLKTGKNAQTKEVPFIIFNVPNELKLEFLKAYLRGDGHCRVRMPKNKRKNWSAEISANTSSRKLISDLVILSLQLGLFPSLSEQITKEHYLYNQKIKGSKTFKITFSKKEDLEKLKWVFPEKTQYLSRYLAITKSRSVLNFPKELIDKNLFYNPKYRKLFTKEFKGRSFYTGYKMFSYERLLNVIRPIKNKDDYLRFLCNIIKNKIAILQIKKISKVKPTKNEVFDVEIPKTDMFVGGVGPILLHNTYGGIIQGLMAAEELAKAYVNNGNYEKLWKKRIGRDLLVGLMIRKKLNSFSNKDYNRLIELVKENDVKRLVEFYDRDFPSRIVLKLLIKEPRFLRFLI